MGLFGKKKKVYVTLQLNVKLKPNERGEYYEKPLDEVLKQEKIGSVEGGGTMLAANKEIEYCDLEIALNSADDMDKLVTLLNAVPIIPKGSILHHEGEKTEVGSMEGLGLYLNGTDLGEEVYKNSDINLVITELGKLLEGQAGLLGFWEGPTETALYYYGIYSVSFEKMKEAILPFTNEYPLCQKCRIVRIA